MCSFLLVKSAVSDLLPEPNENLGKVRYFTSAGLSYCPGPGTIALVLFIISLTFSSLSSEAPLALGELVAVYYPGPGPYLRAGWKRSSIRLPKEKEASFRFSLTAYWPGPGTQACVLFSGLLSRFPNDILGVPCAIVDGGTYCPGPGTSLMHLCSEPGSYRLP